MRTFVMGDVHGAYKAMMQCFERCAFDYDNDLLIHLGDVVDRNSDVFECVEELLKIRNLIAIRGNHDDWFLDFLRTGVHPDNWAQGGWATIRSYLQSCKRKDARSLIPSDVPEYHYKFFDNQRLFYIDASNNCFVHAGFDRHLPFGKQEQDIYYWDRDLWTSALSHHMSKRNKQHQPVFEMATSFREIFIGHTSTTYWKTDKPMNAGNIWNVDTGAGNRGRLTIMEVSTKTYWQSDLVEDLYDALR